MAAWFPATHMSSNLKNEAPTFMQYNIKMQKTINLFAFASVP